MELVSRMIDKKVNLNHIKFCTEEIEIVVYYKYKNIKNKRDTIK